MISKAEKISLQLERQIKAPRDRVYAAWAEPSQLKQWFGPDKVKTRNLLADVRPGGEFRWDLTSPDGEEMTARGEYQEIVPGRKISFSWSWDDDENWENRESLVTITFEDKAGGTLVRLTHEQLPSEQSRDNHSQGWNSLLDKLEQFATR